MIKKIILSLCLMTSVTVFADVSAPVFSSPKNKIIVSQQQPVFSITLPSTPSTGFSWVLKSYPKFLVTAAGHQHVTPKTKLVGTPGYDVWTFKAIKTNYRVYQVGHIVMVYERPWTKQGATTQSFVIVIK